MPSLAIVAFACLGVYAGWHSGLAFLAVLSSALGVVGVYASPALMADFGPPPPRALPQGLPRWVQAPPDPRVQLRLRPSAIVVELPRASGVRLRTATAVVASVLALVPLLLLLSSAPLMLLLLIPLLATLTTDLFTRGMSQRLTLSSRSISWELRSLGRTWKRRSLPLEHMDISVESERLLVRSGGAELRLARGQSADLLQWLTDTMTGAARARDQELAEQGLAQDAVEVPRELLDLSSRR